MIVPTEAVIFDDRGLSVAVAADGKAHLRHVELGAEVDVKQGLNAGDRVIVNPPIGMTDGICRSMWITQKRRAARRWPGNRPWQFSLGTLKFRQRLTYSGISGPQMSTID
jgi:hypothetical protein